MRRDNMHISEFALDIQEQCIRRNKYVDIGSIIKYIFAAVSHGNRYLHIMIGLHQGYSRKIPGDVFEFVAENPKLEAVCI
jgi:hypothetical protein